MKALVVVAKAVLEIYLTLVLIYSFFFVLETLRTQESVGWTISYKYKVVPTPDNALTKRIENIATSGNKQLSQVKFAGYVVNKPLLFFAAEVNCVSATECSIYVGKEYKNLLSDNELDGVLAHEVGHVANGDHIAPSMFEKRLIIIGRLATLDFFFNPQWEYERQQSRADLFAFMVLKQRDIDPRAFEQVLIRAGGDFSDKIYQRRLRRLKQHVD